MADQANTVCDVVVIGGGLAGKAASTHLSKAGLNVICIEPEVAVRPAVGESLDWSAPDLLKALGLPMEQLVEARIATWKRHVTLKTRDGRTQNYVPSEWLAKPPFNVELRTLHLDRLRLDPELLRLAVDHGVRFIADKVVEVERHGGKISSVRTSNGARFSANWFLDASGSGTSLLAREFKIPACQYGPAKVAMWTYFKASNSIDGTTLYVDPSPAEYLDWIWAIPVNPETVSVGYVSTGAAIKAAREQGLSVDDIFQNRLAKFSQFQNAVRSEPSAPLNVTSFRCRVHVKSAGANWMIAGESASMVDPITANGVTAALRQAAEAAAMIMKYRRKGRLPVLARCCYSSRILHLAKFFNGGIEKIVYEPRVRSRIGLGNAGTFYTSPAWSMNLVYARLKPKGFASTFLLNSLLRFFRFTTTSFYQLCRPLRRLSD